MMMSIRRESGIEDMMRHLFSCSDKGKNSTEKAVTSDEVTRVRDWSNLPRDVCNVIAEQITFHPHLCKFAVTCKEWGNVAMAFKDRSSVFLMLPYNRNTCSCQFITLEENPKTYHLKIPELSDQRICGSAKGWLAMTDHNSNFSLFNPLTRKQLPLPKPSDIDPRVVKIFYDFVIDPKSMHVKKVAVSDLGSSANCLVAILFSWNCCLAACRLGDESWTVIPSVWTIFSGYDDIIIHEGKIYAAQESGILIADYHCPGNVATRWIKAPSEPHREINNVYVVISSGRLLYIERHFAPYPKKKVAQKIYKKLTTRFKVYMLENSLSFKEMGDLGGETLFLGPSCSMSVSTKSQEFAHWWKPNCIYFINDKDHEWDNGIFGMEDNVLEKFDLNRFSFHWPKSAFWIFQNI